MLLLLVFQLFSPAGNAQNIRIEGTVRDDNTRDPVPDVSIYIPGTEAGATTDISGSYSLRIPDLQTVDNIEFRHVAYETRLIAPGPLLQSGDVFLTPRIIPFETAEVTGSQPLHSLRNELPQTVSVIEARAFETRGYVDAGDVLRTDHSIQIDEQFSGRKAISMRGGNADEVIVLFGGMRINSSFSNDFDLSLIELSDIERFEIIKGSNTTLYGSNGSSGVINIIPRLHRDYSIRFHQQIGSYDSGIWGLQLYQHHGSVSGSYSLRSGGMTRAFADMPEDKLVNSAVHHSGGISWELSDRGSNTDVLKFHWRLATLEFVNERDGERLDDQNRHAYLQYDGELPLFGAMTLLAGYSGLENDMTLRTSTHSVTRGVHEDGAQARADKHWQYGIFDALFSYQFAYAHLDMEDVRSNLREQPVGIEASRLQRLRHGVVAIGSLHGETGSTFFRSFDFDVSLRHDFVSDAQDVSAVREHTVTEGIFTDREWSHSLFKFAVHLYGIKDDVLLDIFLSYGNNVRFPSLLQQISAPALLDPAHIGEGLEAESNRGVELGTSILRSFSKGVISGWELEGSFFQNSYENKFRAISTPGIPFMLYDNVDDALISGLEGKTGLYFWGKKVLVEMAVSHYFISNQSAFPFKSESKRTIGLRINHAGYSLHVLHFRESEQIGLLRQTDGRYAEVALPAFSNLDLHAGTVFDIGDVRMFLNVSLRNILNEDDVLLSGLALRDRRYYITAGIQY
ncbi:MAG: TonB-dependent receptor plug domain-containing protein [Bacteroidetes bacterium]|nr:TonB-dependent receptor plug domain-containing protein [Bacteroidota bacterium]